MLNVNLLAVTQVISKYIADGKYLQLIIEALVILGIIVAGLIIACKYIKKRYVFASAIVLVVGLIISEILKLQILPIVLLVIFAILVGCASGAVSSHLKSIVNVNQKTKNNKNIGFNEEAKEELIETLIQTVEHLSSRRIGAIITIEKEHSLNTYVDQAVRIDAAISYELLNTIFFPNTALHDGAVIIRGNKIICASAYYPSCNKTDIPQSYGSRHRAAIGISEVSDAFTIVVSEETGKIAVTIGGTITGGISLESLRVSLNQHIIVK